MCLVLVTLTSLLAAWIMQRVGDIVTAGKLARVHAGRHGRGTPPHPSALPVISVGHTAVEPATVDAT